MIRALFEKSPALAERCHDFYADRGLDIGKAKALLWYSYHIRPLHPDRIRTLIHASRGHLQCGVEFQVDVGG